jgi:hypothetical protein
MTPEMAFECLLGTPDPAAFSAMEGILQNFSIATKVCPYPSNGANLLAGGSTDLVVIDLEDPWEYRYCVYMVNITVYK